MPSVATPPRILDSRALASAERPARVFAAFDALAPGEGFVLLTDHAPRCMLPRFQSERPGRFEWSPLEAGPPAWRS